MRTVLLHIIIPIFIHSLFFSHSVSLPLSLFSIKGIERKILACKSFQYLSSSLHFLPDFLLQYGKGMANPTKMCKKIAPLLHQKNAFYALVLMCSPNSATRRCSSGIKFLNYDAKYYANLSQMSLKKENFLHHHCRKLEQIRYHTGSGTKMHNCFVGKGIVRPT